MTSRRCSACSYAMAMQRAAREILLSAWSSAVVLAVIFVAPRLFGSTEIVRGIADFLSCVVAMVFNASVPVIVFSRVFDVATLRRYMREFDEPCPVCGGKHD